MQAEIIDIKIVFPKDVGRRLFDWGWGWSVYDPSQHENITNPIDMYQLVLGYVAWIDNSKCGNNFT